MEKIIEKIIPKPQEFGMVGNGFRVYNMIPGSGVSQHRMSPFLLLDFNPAINFSPTNKQRGVDVHPHKGFETVTIAYKGSVSHHDSAGNSGTIRPGDVQWMTAGSGVLHKEYHEKEFSQIGGIFEMVQLWVNLPKKYKTVPARYQALTSDKMGKIELPDGKGIVNVIAGELNTVKGPADTYSPVNLFDIRLREGAGFKFNVPANHNTAILVIEGNVSVNSGFSEQHSFVLFKNEGEEITIESNEDAVVLLLSGEPLNEPIVSYGPFVMNTKEEIYEAIEEFQSGKFGVLN